MRQFSKFAAFAALVFTGTVANAALFTLTDGDATVTIDTNNTSGAIRNFAIGSTDTLFAGDFYWRIGGGTATSITNTAAGSTTATAIGNNRLDVTYTQANFTMRVIYTLTGGVGMGDLAEQVVITNTSNGALDFRLWQYADFDLPGANTIERTGAASMRQTSAQQWTMNTTATSVPNFSQLGGFPAVRTQILTADADLLVAAGNGIGEVFNGDSTYGFEWVRNLGVGEAMFVSSDKILAVPEPATMVGLGLAASLIAARRRKKA